MGKSSFEVWCWEGTIWDREQFHEQVYWERKQISCFWKKSEALPRGPLVEPVTLNREPSYLQVTVRPFLSPESSLYCLSTGRLKIERRKKEMDHVLPVPPVKEGLGVR